MIREGWIESERVNQLDAAAEVFFLRLCLRADDFGRYHANPVLLRANLYPLREEVGSKDIPKWLEACESAGLIVCYEADGKRFLEIPKFGQRMRAAVSKFPPPAVTCQSNDGHVSDRRRPESESEGEAEADGATRREISRIPTSLKTPAFEAAWSKWLDHWGDKHHHKPIPFHTADAHLTLCVKFGPSLAAQAIDNAIARDLREPALPFESSKPHGNNRQTNSRHCAASDGADYSGVTDK